MVRVFRHHLVNNQIETLRHFGTKRLRRWIRSLLFCDDQLQRRITREWQSASQQMIQSCTERIDVNSLIKRASRSCACSGAIYNGVPSPVPL